MIRYDLPTSRPRKGYWTDGLQPIRWSKRGAAAFTPTISVTLKDGNNDPATNLTGLAVAWWDSPLSWYAGTAATLYWTGQTTDASGVLSVTTLTGSGLTSAGQIGWINVTNSTADPNLNASENVAEGPVAVS